MKKLIPLSLSLVLSIQTAALATQSQADRTAGIGLSEAQKAKANLQNLSQEIRKLDGALAQLQNQIEKREAKANWLNGVSVAGAGVGLGLSAMATFMFKANNGSGSGIGGAIYGAGAILFSVGSAVTGAAKTALKPEVDKTQLADQLILAQNKIDNSVLATSDKVTKSLLIQLSENIKASREALAEYSANDTSDTRTYFYSQIAQATGVALTVFGTTQKQSRLVGIGAMVMSAGNLGQIVGTLTDSEATVVLKEIENTRRALAINLRALN